jgi:predicted Rossmann fold nucleotide-binding protein DprA/Smf involved in DNA uptake
MQTARRRPSRIISGGQTGVDRAALDAALATGIDHGGWCPRGRRAEDGPIASRYRLRETRSARYHVRTRANVLAADGTLILSCGPLTGGTELTRRVALEHAKPCFVLDLDAGPPDPAAVHAWLADHRVEVLNVAGPRESTRPGVTERALRFLLEAFAPEGR